MSDASMVVVTDVYPATLIFHEWGSFQRVELDDEWHRSETRTTCGLLLAATEWRDPVSPTPGVITRSVRTTETRLEYRRPFSTLRRDHADKIGRPCQRCWT